MDDIVQIAQNVQNMRDAGASPDRVAEYLATEGLTWETFAQEAQLAAQRQQPVRHGPVEGALAQVNQGLLMGFNDEFQAGLGAIADKITGKGDLVDSYRRRQAEQELAQSQYARENPMTSGLATAAGAMLPVAAGVGAVGAGVRPLAAVASRLRGTGPLAPAPLQPASSTVSGGLGAQVRQSASAGGLYGGTEAVGSAPTAEKDTLEGALGTAGEGIAIGAALGGALPPLTAAAGKLAEPARKLSAYVGDVVGGVPPPTARQAALSAPVASPEASGGAVSRALDSLEAGGMDPAVVREQVAARRGLGMPAAAVDVAPQPTQRLARAARTMGDRGVTDANLGSRAAEQGERVAGQLERAVGVPPVPAGPGAEVAMARGRESARPLYDAAYATGRIEDEAVLRDLVDRADVWAGPHETARLLMLGSEGAAKAPKPLYGPEGELLRTPDVRDIDLIKRGVDAKLYDSRRGIARDPKDSLDAEAQRAIQQSLRGEGGLLPAVDRAVPVYGEARAAFQEGARIKGVIEDGADILTSGKSAADIAQELTGLTAQEAALYRGAALQRVLTQIREAASRAEGANVLRDIFGWSANGNRDKLRALIGDSKKFAEFEAYAKAELDAVTSRRFITGGSQTADKAAEAAQQVFDVSGTAADVTRGGLMHTAGGIFRRMVSGLEAGFNAGTRADLARGLTSTAGQDADDFLRAVERLREQRMAGMLRRPALSATSGVAATQQN